MDVCNGRFLAEHGRFGDTAGGISVLEVLPGAGVEKG